ncbi:Dynein light chain [Schistosoma japonicum]|nr:Dynein light chain [Schistosoma japonicum]
MALQKAVIKDSDMDRYMQEEAINVAATGMDRHEVDKDIASHIKQYFNLKYGRTWHCIVGKQFGSDISHEEGSFLYFFLGDRTVLLYKSG